MRLLEENSLGNIERSCVDSSPFRLLASWPFDKARDPEPLGKAGQKRREPDVEETYGEQKMKDA